MTSKKELSEEGELRFAAELKRKGWRIFLPFGEDSPVDLLIEKEGMFKRVQVKSTRSEGEIISCRLKSSNNWQVKKYTAEEIDYFAIYEAIKKEGYLIPISDVEGMTEISLRKGAAKNNQKKGIRQAENYQYF